MLNSCKRHLGNLMWYKTNEIEEIAIKTADAIHWFLVPFIVLFEPPRHDISTKIRGSLAKFQSNETSKKQSVNDCIVETA